MCTGIAVNKSANPCNITQVKINYLRPSSHCGRYTRLSKLHITSRTVMEDYYVCGSDDYFILDRMDYRIYIWCQMSMFELISLYNIMRLKLRESKNISKKENKTKLKRTKLYMRLKYLLQYKSSYSFWSSIIECEHLQYD